MLPSVVLSGSLRDRERMVSVSTRTAANAQIEVFLQVFCFDKQLTVHRRQRTVTGTGQVRVRLRKPRALQGLHGERLGESDEPTAVSIGPASQHRSGSAAYCTRAARACDQ